MKRFLFALIVTLLAWVQPVMAQDSFDSFSDPDGGAWNSQDIPTVVFLPMGGSVVLNKEEAGLLRDSVSRTLGMSPGGLITKPLFDKATKGEVEQDDIHKLYWYILVVILAIYVLADDFIWLFKNWAKAGAWKVVKKIFIILATFVSIPIPIWDVIFLVIRTIIKIIKVIRTTKRVVRTAKAVSKAGENPQAAAMAARQAAASYSAKRAADGQKQTQQKPSQESGRPQTETTAQNQAQANAPTPGQTGPAVEQSGGRNSAQVAYVQKRLDEVEQLWREPKDNKKGAQAQGSNQAETKDSNTSEAEQKKPETGNPLNKRYEKMPEFEGEKLYDPSKGPIKMADPNAPASAQKKPTRQGRRADIRGKRAAPSAGIRRGSRTRTRA